MSRLENDLAKLILENNNRNGINSNGPSPSISFNNNNSSSSYASNDNGKASLNVPSIIVNNGSTTTDGSSGSIKKGDGFLNVNSFKTCDSLFKRTTNNSIGSSSSGSSSSNSDLTITPPPIIIVNTSDEDNTNNNNNNNCCKEQNVSTNKNNNNSENIYDRKLLEQQMKQKKIQFKERRDPSNVLIFENIDSDKAQLVKTLVEDQNLNFSFSVQLVRYLSHFRSLMLVFSHRNEAELCKLLVSRQDSFKLDSDTIVYFGKDTPLQLINKYQLNTPFPTRQYLISPPLSPPNEWSAPGDGMEQPPSDIDPFAEVTTISAATATTTINNNYNNNNNNNNNSCSVVYDDEDYYSEKPSSSIMAFSTASPTIQTTNENNKNNDVEIENDDDDDEEDYIKRSYKKIIYQDHTSNNFPSITLEFCT